MSLVTDRQVAQRLALMHEVLPAYGRQLTPDAAAIWLALLHSEEVTSDEWAASTTWWLAHRSELPAPADILRRIRRQRAENVPLVRPVEPQVEALPGPQVSRHSDLAAIYGKVKAKLLARGE